MEWRYQQINFLRILAVKVSSGNSTEREREREAGEKGAGWNTSLPCPRSHASPRSLTRAHTHTRACVRTRCVRMAETRRRPAACEDPA